jgi:hypothetical protein
MWSLIITYLGQYILTFALSSFAHDALRKKGVRAGAIVAALIISAVFWFVMQLVAVSLIKHQSPGDVEANGFLMFGTIVITPVVMLVLIFRHLFYIRRLRLMPFSADAQTPGHYGSPEDVQKALMIIGPVVYIITFLFGWVMMFAVSPI